MGVIDELKTGLDRGREKAEECQEREFFRLERHSFYKSEPASQLTRGDNLVYMKWLLDHGWRGRLRMIYIDPPFFTRSKFDAAVQIRDAEGKVHRIKHLAYDDTFERNLEYYAANMTARLILMKELLSDDGLIWVHLDWHSSHYMKILMDEIFGAANFQNEIIWKYKSGGSGRRHFSRKHDTILVYSKTKNYYLNVPKEKSYNRGLRPYRFKGVKEYRDEYGWYTMVNMKDVWSIDMVGRTSKERNGYATQKPLELMTRIVEASTEKGDCCGDFFCGSGSMLEAAERAGRTWIGCDIEELGISAARKRLDNIMAEYDCYGAERIKPGGLRLDFVQAEELENGKRLYTYRIASFEPAIDYGHMSFKDRQLCDALCREVPEHFIDYIMIDPDYDGSFSAELLPEQPEREIKFISHGDFAVKVVDVFGKEYFYDGRE